MPDDPRLVALRRLLPPGDLWVFGYASLMWAPGFPHRDQARAHIFGYHRSLCIYSHRHRGTPDRPGLVMGLCRGGSCWGLAFRIARADRTAAVDALWHREMLNQVYQPRVLQARLGPQRRVVALGFVANAAHRQFAGDLSVEETARLVAQGHGGRGRNVEYLQHTLAHMHELGVRDPHLERALALALQLQQAKSPGENRSS